MTTAGKSALFWIVLVVTAGFVTGLVFGLEGPHSQVVENWINIVGGIAVAAGGVFMLWRFRDSGSTPQPIRAPLRMVAGGQTLLGISLFIPDVRLRAAALAIVVIPVFVAGVRVRRAVRAMKRT